MIAEFYCDDEAALARARARVDEGEWARAAALGRAALARGGATFRDGGPVRAHPGAGVEHAMRSTARAHSFTVRFAAAGAVVLLAAACASRSAGPSYEVAQPAPAATTRPTTRAPTRAPRQPAATAALPGFPRAARGAAAGHEAARLPPCEPLLSRPLLALPSDALVLRIASTPPARWSPRSCDKGPGSPRWTRPSQEQARARGPPRGPRHAHARRARAARRAQRGREDRRELAR